jgi:hypothetical protein
LNILCASPCFSEFDFASFCNRSGHPEAKVIPVIAAGRIAPGHRFAKQQKRVNQAGKNGISVGHRYGGAMRRCVKIKNSQMYSRLEGREELFERV